jgi:hypothetical protein
VQTNAHSEHTPKEARETCPIEHAVSMFRRCGNTA